MGMWLFMVFLLLIFPKIVMIIGGFFTWTFVGLAYAIYEIIKNLILKIKSKIKKEQ